MTDRSVPSCSECFARITATDGSGRCALDPEDRSPLRHAEPMSTGDQPGPPEWLQCLDTWRGDCPPPQWCLRLRAVACLSVDCAPWRRTPHLSGDGYRWVRLDRQLDAAREYTDLWLRDRAAAEARVRETMQAARDAPPVVLADIAQGDKPCL